MMGRIVSRQREVGTRWSVGQLERLALHFLGKPSRGLPERCLVTQHRVADARHFVSERASALVVIGAGLQLERPLTQANELEAFHLCDFGRAQHGACAVG
jgi:hypothetical protein